MKDAKNKYAINFMVIIALTLLALWFAMKDNYREVLDLIAVMKWYWLLIILL